jgi:hypothetical protein
MGILILPLVACEAPPAGPLEPQIRYPIGAGRYQYYADDGRPTIVATLDGAPPHLRTMLSVQLGKRTWAPAPMVYRYAGDDPQGRFSIAELTDRTELARDSDVAWSSYAAAERVWERTYEMLGIGDEADHKRGTPKRRTSPKAPKIEIVNLDIDTRAHPQPSFEPASNPFGRSNPFDGAGPLNGTPDPLTGLPFKIPGLSPDDIASARSPSSGGEVTGVLAATNRARAAGADCGTYGKFGSTQPLAGDSSLHIPGQTDRTSNSASGAPDMAGRRPARTSLTAR